MTTLIIWIHKVTNLTKRCLFLILTIEEEKTECDKPITESECSEAISQLANNKSPGLDGFSVEFYKTSWQDLKELFINCHNYSLTKLTNRLCDSQYEGVITLIPKPGKDCMNVSNYRPITLLNCDYKIISKVINNRLYVFCQNSIMLIKMVS